MQMRIGGVEIAAADDRWMPVINPATGDEIDRVPRGSAAEVDLAVQAARHALDGWAKKTVRERGMVLFHAAHLVREEHETLARTLTAEQGKPLREATDEIRGFANILEFYAGISAGVQGEMLRLGTLGDCMVTHEPLGVCGAIVPWNMPALIMGWKVGPALLAGNTMVFKPASQTPLTALCLAGLMEHSGLPPGVLNLVTGPGEVVGEAIARHHGIAKVSFTGDVATGYRVRELAGQGLKAVTLELGGSDPMIVWKDADLENAANGAVRGRFYNAGQTCTAVKRLFVHQSVAPEFMRLLLAKVKVLRVGNGMDPGVEMGPLAGKAQAGEDHLPDGGGSGPWRGKSRGGRIRSKRARPCPGIFLRPHHRHGSSPRVAPPLRGGLRSGASRDLHPGPGCCHLPGEPDSLRAGCVGLDEGPRGGERGIHTGPCRSGLGEQAPHHPPRTPLRRGKGERDRKGERGSGVFLLYQDQEPFLRMVNEGQAEGKFPDLTSPGSQWSQA